MTSCITSNFGKAFQRVRGGPVSVDGGCDGQRFPGVAFSLLWLILGDCDASACRKRLCQIDAGADCDGLIRPPSGRSKITTRQRDLGDGVDNDHPQPTLRAQSLGGDFARLTRGRNVSCGDCRDCQRCARKLSISMSARSTRC